MVPRTEAAPAIPLVSTAVAPVSFSMASFSYEIPLASTNALKGILNRLSFGNIPASPAGIKTGILLLDTAVFLIFYALNPITVRA